MEPGLLVYGHVLDDTLRRAEHTGSPDEEAVIASAGLVTDGPYATYGMLANADAPWPTVRLSGGEEIVLDQAAFAKHRGGPEREDRQAVFESFWSVWASYARTFGMLLYTQVKRDLFYARVRSYENSLESALDGDRIPQSVPLPPGTDHAQPGLRMTGEDCGHRGHCGEHALLPLQPSDEGDSGVARPQCGSDGARGRSRLGIDTVRDHRDR